MAKISRIKNMSQVNDVGLINGGCTEIILFRSALLYDAYVSIVYLPNFVAFMIKYDRDVIFFHHK